MSIQVHRRASGLAIAVIVAFVALVAVGFLALRQQHSPQDLGEAPRDPSAWAVEMSPEQAAKVDRIPRDPDLDRIYNQTRGRPPVQEGGSIDVPGERRNWFWRQRAYPLDTIPADANLKALREVQQQVQAQSPEQSWQSLGPAPIKEGALGIYQCSQVDCDMWRTDISGRTKAIVFNPQNPNTMYVATATGGIWKSTNGGSTFVPLTDDQPSLAFHSLTLDPQNPNTIYGGTGELGGYYGVGILKSTNGGANWTVLGGDVFQGLVVSAIVVHPTNSNLVYAAVAEATNYKTKGVPAPTRGVFRSNNGGQSWTPILSCSDCYGVSDLVMEDSNPQILYAGAGGYGIFKTTNGGDNWTQLTNGLPDRGFARIELGIGRGGGSGTIYAGFDAKVSVGGSVKPWGLVYKSTDHGSSWQRLEQAPNYCSSQCWYDNIVAVDPGNANVVYLGGNYFDWKPETMMEGVVLKSEDGGVNWYDMTPATSLDKAMHADMHAIAFHPNNSSEVWIGNDGGLYRSTNGGQTWQNRNASLATTQFVGIAVHPTNANIAFGGLQDNAKAKFDGTRWTGMDTGDGGYSAIDPFEPNYWYGSRFSQQGSFVQFQRNDKGGTAPLSDWQSKASGVDVNDRVAFYIPIEVDPSTPGVVYLGTHRLYRTANRGNSWQPISGDLTQGESTYGTVESIGVAPGDPNTIYTGSSDGIVAVTRNLGNSWKNVTASTMPNRYVSDIAVSSQSADKAYVTFNGFSAHTPGQPGKVFRTSNGGSNWQDITNNLPDVPVLSVDLDPLNPNHVYVGTDIGVFRSINDGASWSYFNQGMAAAPVTQLILNNNTRHLWAGTYGRGVYRLNLGGSAPTPTPTTPPGVTLQMYMPMTLKAVRQAPTPTPPSSGPAPGEWKGENTTFSVTSDQTDVWNVRIRVPVPGCETWLQHPIAKVQNNRFSFDVDLRENGFWSDSGRFTSSTAAVGTAKVDDMYFGTSCGTWSGTVEWSATWSGQGQDPTPTPTSTPRPPTATPSGTNGIHGQVTFKDQGIGGINLILRRCPNSGSCDLNASKIASTKTDGQGYYQFTGVPALPAGNTYFVMYFNHSDGGNSPDDSYVWRWYGPDITSYSAGSSISGGDFEIANIALTGPRTEQTSLPVDFTWTTRNVPGERYSLELFDLQSGNSLCFSDPSTTPSFTMTANDLLSDCGGNYNVDYGWFVWALDGATWETTESFGDSYYFAKITFTGGGGPTATPTTLVPTSTPTSPAATSTPTPIQPTPTRTPTATSVPAKSISGQVTAAGSPAGGLTLQLLLCDSGSCFVDSTSGTSGGGYYQFSNVGELAAGEFYRVRYVNGPAGGNPVNTNHLAWWVTGPIYDVTAQTGTANVSFDVGDVVLISPPHNYSGVLPIVFSWLDRGVPGDYFAWATSYAGTQFCSVNPPEAATSLILDYATAVDCGMFTFDPYEWYVYVTKGPTFGNGLGLSFFNRTYMITGAMGAREGRQLQQQGAVPNLSTQALDFPEGMIPDIGDLAKP